MASFWEDFESAHREIYGHSHVPDLQPRKKTRARRKQSKKPRFVKTASASTEQYTNKLKKRHGPSKQVLSENAKAQPRSQGKFASKNTFWTRLGEVFSGKAKRKIRASKRRARELDARMGRASIPQAERRRRTRRRRSRPVAEQPQSFRKNVLLQILGLSGR